MKENNRSLEEVLNKEQIYAFGKEKDKNGNHIQPIRHLRCKVKKGPGYVLFPSEIKLVEKAFESKKEYKRYTYANNGETPVCAIYEWTANGKLKREISPIPILQMSRTYHFDPTHEFVEENKVISKGPGKKSEITKRLTTVLHRKQLVIFYKDQLEELKELYISEAQSFSNRIYTAETFEDGGRIVFIHHLCSLPDKEIAKVMEERGYKNGASYVDFESPFLKLRLRQAALNMAVEGKDFEVAFDGEVKWSF